MTKQSVTVAIAWYMELEGYAEANRDSMKNYIMKKDMSLNEIGDYLFWRWEIGLGSVAQSLEEHAEDVPQWAIDRKDWDLIVPEQI
jgi:hypothetical protein